MNIIVIYWIYPKYSDSYAWANSVKPEKKTATKLAVW